MPTLTEDQIFKVTRQFFDRLKTEGCLSQEGDEKYYKNPFIIAVTGFPGSGKSMAAAEFARLTEGIHIQANSIRQLLRELGLPWGDNIRAIRDEVIKELLWRNHAVILDGSVLENAEWQHLVEIAKEKKAKLFFVAIKSEISLATLRADDRFEFGLDSTFRDWKPSTDMLRPYYESMADRAKKLEQFIAQERSVIVLDNNGAVAGLQNKVAEAWEKIQTQL